MEKLYLIVTVAGQKVALDAERVSAVVEVDRVTPVPRVPAHIAGLFALRSRVLTVVDAQAALGYAPMAIDGLLTGVIVTVDGHGYALLVDDVADVISAPPPEAVGAVLGSRWSQVALGRVATGDGDLLLVDPAQLILADAIAA